MPGASWIEILLGWGAMPVALLLNPLLLGRITMPGVGRERLPLIVAVWSLVLQPVLALIFHLTSAPIAPFPLIAAHFGIAVACLVLLRAVKRPLLPVSGAWPLGQLWILLLLAIFTFPFTHLGGIDAYKWGDLATAVALERNIPWLIHPLSLLGFTARSYPSLHPLLMGSIRALGATSIEAAFFLASLVMCGVGVTSASYLAERLGLQKRETLLYTAFYALSPVFMRYVHWGTGRGAFLAVLPLFVAALADLPRLKAWPLALFSGLLLVLSHKTGLICVVVFPLIRLASLLYPRRHPILCLLLLVLSFVASVMFAPVRYFGVPPGLFAGWIRYDLARFAWMSPALVLAVIVAFPVPAIVFPLHVACLIDHFPRRAPHGDVPRHDGVAVHCLCRHSSVACSAPAPARLEGTVYPCGPSSLPRRRAGHRSPALHRGHASPRSPRRPPHREDRPLWPLRDHFALEVPHPRHCHRLPPLHSRTRRKLRYLLWYSPRGEAQRPTPLRRRMGRVHTRHHPNIRHNRLVW